MYKSLSKSASASAGAGGQNHEAPHATTDGAAARKNRQRVLVLSSRGVNHRHRHLINDLAVLIPVRNVWCNVVDVYIYVYTASLVTSLARLLTYLLFGRPTS